MGRYVDISGVIGMSISSHDREYTSWMVGRAGYQWLPASAFPVLSVNLEVGIKVLSNTTRLSLEYGPQEKRVEVFPALNYVLLRPRLQLDPRV